MDEPTKNRDLAMLTALARASGASDAWLLRLGLEARLVYSDYDEDNDEIVVTEPLGAIADALLIYRFPEVAGENEGGFYTYDPAFAHGDPEMRAVAMLHLVLKPLVYSARQRVLRYALDRLVDSGYYSLEDHAALQPPATGVTERLEEVAEVGPPEAEAPPAPRRRGRPAKALGQ